MEVAQAVAPGAAEVNEMDMISQAFHHTGQVVVGPYTVRTGAEAQAVGSVGRSCQQFAGILFGAYYAGQAQYRKGRIVWMNGQFYAGFFGHRRDLLEEVEKVQ